MMLIWSSNRSGVARRGSGTQEIRLNLFSLLLGLSLLAVDAGRPAPSSRCRCLVPMLFLTTEPAAVVSRTGPGGGRNIYKTESVLADVLSDVLADAVLADALRSWAPSPASDPLLPTETGNDPLLATETAPPPRILRLELQRCAHMGEFTVHGLWPQWAEYCDDLPGSIPFDERSLRDLEPALRQSWPSCAAVGPSSGASSGAGRTASPVGQLRRMVPSAPGVVAAARRLFLRREPPSPWRGSGPARPAMPTRASAQHAGIILRARRREAPDSVALVPQQVLRRMGGKTCCGTAPWQDQEVLPLPAPERRRVSLCAVGGFLFPCAVVEDPLRPSAPGRSPTTPIVEQSESTVDVEQQSESTATVDGDHSSTWSKVVSRAAHRVTQRRSRSAPARGSGAVEGARAPAGGLTAPARGRADAAFWAHEWRRHGTCAVAGLPAELRSMHDYFRKTLKLYQRYAGPFCDERGSQTTCSVCFDANDGWRLVLCGKGDAVWSRETAEHRRRRTGA